MARARRDGVLIAGGGLAGCLAALALAKHRPEVPLLIVEEKERFGGDRYWTAFDGGLDEQGRALIEPLAAQRWPGFYVAFPGFSRKLRAEMSGIAGESIHSAMIETLKPDQYRLGTRVVAVREDSLVLDGGETIKADGAIDARGAANLSLLELSYRAWLARDYRFDAPHRVDRPVLVDATVEQRDAFRYVECIPLGEDRLLVIDACLADHGQLNPAAAGKRLDHYIALRGWRGPRIEGERSGLRPLPTGGDFAAFWRIGGARVAKLGLRGGFFHPATGSTVADSARNALLLAEQRDFSGAALHDTFEEQAKRLWRRRDFYRALNQDLAAVGPQGQRAITERLYRLDPALIGRFQADRLGMLDRRAVEKAARGT